MLVDAAQAAEMAITTVSRGLWELPVFTRVLD